MHVYCVVLFSFVFIFFRVAGTVPCRPDLMVKKLRYYARFIVVCLLLKKMKLVRDLVRVSSVCFFVAVFRRVIVICELCCIHMLHYTSCRISVASSQFCHLLIL